MILSQSANTELYYSNIDIVSVCSANRYNKLSYPQQKRGCHK